MRFTCHDGIHVKNLQELASALEQMSDDTFYYHVNESKNDFSKWVRDVIGDDKLSRDLDKTTNRLQAAKSVAARIGLLNTRVYN